jgi:hypothetical protein
MKINALAEKVVKNGQNGVWVRAHRVTSISNMQISFL